MNVFNVSSETDLRSIIGYWDGSAGSAVSGQSGDGDIVILPPKTITATGVDRVLYASPGVLIIGHGLLSVLSGFGFRCIGTGGTGRVLGLSNWTLDINGLAATSAGASSAFGGAILENVSWVRNNWRVVNNTPTSGGNNLTVSTEFGTNAVEGLSINPYIVGAHADCLSTKGGTGQANRDSLYREFGGTIETPGLGASDQAVTPHGGAVMEMYGTVISGNASGSNLAYVQASDGFQNTDQILTNCTITGQVIANKAQFFGCLMDLGGEDLRLPGRVEDCRISNFGTADTDYAISYQLDNSLPAVLKNVDIRGAGGGTAVFVNNSGYAAVAAIDGLVATDMRRGLDFRSGSGHTVADAVIQASQFAVLNNTSSSTFSSVSGVTSDAGYFGINAGGIAIEDPLLQATIDAQRAKANVLSAVEPAITQNWSDSILKTYEILVNYSLSPIHAWSLNDGPWSNAESLIDDAGASSLTANTSALIDVSGPLPGLSGAGPGAVFSSSDNERFSESPCPTTAVPLPGLSFEVTAQLDTLGSTRCLLASGDGADDAFSMRVFSSGVFLAYLFVEGVNKSAQTTSPVISSGDPFHAIVSLDQSTGDPTIFINGTEAASSFSSQSLSVADRISIGAFHGSTPSLECDGAVVDAKIWPRTFSIQDAKNAYAAVSSKLTPIVYGETGVIGNPMRGRM